MEKRVKFNVSHNYDHLTFNAGEEYELTDQQYNNMNSLDAEGKPLTPGAIKLFTDVAGDLKPVKDKV